MFAIDSIVVVVAVHLHGSGALRMHLIWSLTRICPSQKKSNSSAINHSHNRSPQSIFWATQARVDVCVCVLVTARSKEKTVNCCVHQKGCSGSVVRVTPVVQSSSIGERRASVTCARLDNSSLPAAAISVATNTWLDSSALANSANNLATHTHTHTGSYSYC